MYSNESENEVKHNLYGNTEESLYDDKDANTRI